MADDDAVVSLAWFEAYAKNAAHELIEEESAHVAALADAITYRWLYLETLTKLAETVEVNRTLRKRVRQLVGAEPWSGENPDGEDGQS